MDIQRLKKGGKGQRVGYVTCSLLKLWYFLFEFHVGYIS